MEGIQEAKQLIGEAKNIYIIPDEKNSEGIACALALFYTLKELNKNVNLVVDELPENLKALTPSLDFVTFPKNFIISIPNKVADISQIYYEKNDDSLKIHLAVSGGNIKKENISFYFSNFKPDLVITIGIQNFRSQLSNRLDSYGFLLESDILNIDNEQKNEKFGKINLSHNKSLTELIFSLVKMMGDDIIKQNTASCLLKGLIIHTDNFKNNNVTAEIFETAADLMKKGASFKENIENI